ncbi:plasmid mobilization relaxosome protein MobC [Leptolyngbyaceae cyanobacterium CCMR0082]|uniref:Plasmid mobilization relaxosome protein MobC n=1 Tax=Adonisia turfae CCMR0082 TaxID=2304604 RepID=A0A6M0S9I5_9CYAN|nr:plasmid mobilization relaxosome protein MobC [Adonisia turfae]NEZ65158.1 plasmid mobilization relaxosome protein MobC [Adonisia turfae CCMR0082]
MLDSQYRKSSVAVRTATIAMHEQTFTQRDSHDSPDVIVTLRFKAEEIAIINEDVAASGLSRNAYFRQLALEAPVPRKARQRASGEHARVYSQWLGQLGKIGSNLNQLVRQLNVAKKVGDPGMAPSNQELLCVVYKVLSVLQASAQELRASITSKSS